MLYQERCFSQDFHEYCDSTLFIHLPVHLFTDAYCVPDFVVNAKSRPILEFCKCPGEMINTQFSAHHTVGRQDKLKTRVVQHRKDSQYFIATINGV